MYGSQSGRLTPYRRLSRVIAGYVAGPAFTDHDIEMTLSPHPGAWYS